jgi:hypothetical protein
MTVRTEFQALKAVAKQRARAQRIAHSMALDAIAAELGLPHWNALTAAWERGWRPTAAQMKSVRGPDNQMASSREISHVEKSTGEISGEPYELEIDFDSVLVSGNGWAVHVGHAPSEKAQVEKYVTPNPLDDPAFFKEVIEIANSAADRVREAISQDWPRRSTKPDRAGRVTHPLFGEISAEWFCLHCDAGSTAAQMAANMWHCPKCSATPLDISARRLN